MKKSNSNHTFNIVSTNIQSEVSEHITVGVKADIISPMLFGQSRERRFLLNQSLLKKDLRNPSTVCFQKGEEGWGSLRLRVRIRVAWIYQTFCVIINRNCAKSQERAKLYVIRRDYSHSSWILWSVPASQLFSILKTDNIIWGHDPAREKGGRWWK